MYNSNFEAKKDEADLYAADIKRMKQKAVFAGVQEQIDFKQAQKVQLKRQLEAEAKECEKKTQEANQQDKAEKDRVKEKRRAYMAGLDKQLTADLAYK